MLSVSDQSEVRGVKFFSRTDRSACDQSNGSQQPVCVCVIKKILM